MKEKKSFANSEGNSVFFGLATQTLDDSGRWSLKPNFRRIAIACACATAAAYLAAAACAFGYFKYVKNFEGMGFYDALCAPFDMESLRVKMGEENIKQAEKFFAQKKFMEGFMTLRAGVARAPDNLAARRSLAGLYLAALHKPAEASKLLEARLQKAFEQKDAGYVAQTSATFAMSGEYAQKAHLLLAKALDENIIGEKEAAEILKAIFANEAPPKEKLAGFKTSVQKLAKFPKTRAYAAKCAALLMLRADDARGAAKMLAENGIEHGEIFAQVKMRELLEEGKETEALRLAEDVIKTTSAPSHTYFFMRKIHSEFGNAERAEHAQKMGYLTSSSRLASEIYSAVKNGDAEKLGIILDKNKGGAALAAAVKISIDLGNGQALDICRKIIADAQEPARTKLNLAIFEAMFEKGKADGAERILTEAKTRKNPPEIEDIIADMSMAMAMKRGENTAQMLEQFKKRNSPEQMEALADMLRRAKMFANALEVLEAARQKSPDAGNIEMAEAVCLFEAGDFAAAARKIARSKKRCPNKILCAPKMRDYASDIFIMLSDEERAAFAKKTEEAAQKLKEYKAEYN